MSKMETRTFTVDDLEVREAPEGMSFEGYAARSPCGRPKLS